MFFGQISEIMGVAARTGCAIFVVPEGALAEFGDFARKRTDVIFLMPEEKKVITIEQVKEVFLRLNLKQTRDVFVVISPAEALGEEAANALLKNLEEPQEKVHFVLMARSASEIISTILSRSQVYFLKDGGVDFDTILADEKVKVLAKRLVTARTGDLVGLLDEMVPKGEDGVRAYVMGVLAVAIEMLFKSYFKTGKEAFLIRIPKFITAYENIEKNGHIKLHLVADLI